MVSTVVSTEVVSDVVELVVVSLSAESPPQAVNNDATAIPAPKANRVILGTPREVMKRRLPVPARA